MLSTPQQSTVPEPDDSNWKSLCAQLSPGQKELALKIWEILGDSKSCRSALVELDDFLQKADNGKWFLMNATSWEKPHGMKTLWTVNPTHNFVNEVSKRGGPFHDPVAHRNSTILMESPHGSLSHRLQWYILARRLKTERVAAWLQDANEMTEKNLNGFMKLAVETKAGDQTLWGVLFEERRVLGDGKARSPTSVVAMVWELKELKTAEEEAQKMP